MAVIDASYWTSHRTAGFIGLAMVALFSLNALNAFQKYFEILSHWWRCSQDRCEVMTKPIAQRAFRGGRPNRLSVAPSSGFFKMQSFASSPRSPPHLISTVKNKSLRSWYRSAVYAQSFPARREDYMTDLRILETFLQCEEERERYAQLCGKLASASKFWDYRRPMNYYSRALMGYQYQVACMPQAPFTHRRQPPVEGRSSRRLGYIALGERCVESAGNSSAVSCTGPGDHVIPGELQGLSVRTGSSRGLRVRTTDPITRADRVWRRGAPVLVTSPGRRGPGHVLLGSGSSAWLVSCWRCGDAVHVAMTS
ncbi:uncharacterized protein [Eleutherodactylus coqui]|uniref:uncharacterized protein n=1 Tax=Eleutherodactylus coqui TaxID=57060 RepID=UPI00346330A7